MNMNQSDTASGRKRLFRDSKLGNLVNGAVGAAVLYVAEAVAGFDVTPLPDALEPIAIVALPTIAGLVTSWWAKRGR